MFTMLPDRRRPLPRWLAVSWVAALGLVVGACSSSSNNTTTTTAPGGVTTTTVKLASAALNGSGSTFQLAFDQEVIQEFHAAYPKVTVNYGGGGSSKGLTDLQNKLVQYAGTDAAPVKDATPFGGPGSVLYFPTVAAPINVAFNLSGGTKLTLSGTTLAKIYAGKVTTWNAAEIAADNPGVPNLPPTKITPVHRSDGSGTTHNFTLYLGKVDPGDWTYGSSTTFPTNLGGATGNGNQGVAATVQSTDGAVGYVDFATAKAAGLNSASIKNEGGTAIAPTLAGASAAVAAASINPDLTYDPTNASAPAAYPITSPTWIVVYKTQTDHNVGLALKTFLSFILTTGETQAAATSGYAPLAGDLLTKARAQVDTIVVA